MKEIFSLITIGIALSMDTFSLSLSVGTLNASKKKALQLSLIVGIMHFIMPFLGMLIGDQLIQIFELKCDLVFGIILIFIAIQMIIDVFKNEEEKFKLTLLGMFIFAFGVSIDSFSLGIGIKAITENMYLAMSIFCICSFLFTYVGIKIGSFASELIGKYASILGAIILVIIGLTHLL